MNLEKEVTILEIDKEKFEKRLNLLGATKVGDFHQKRLVYDFKEINTNKWIRLRTNGTKTTLAIKEVIDKFRIDGTRELEIEVDDFEKTNAILNELGYTPRNYQENLRTIYMLDDVEISIDSWPLIPTYAEIEGKTNEEVTKMINKLNVDNDKVTTLDVESIYREIYGINVLEISELKF